MSEQASNSRRDVVIADVLYCEPDETLYVLDSRNHQTKYEGGWLEQEVSDRLRADGWRRCGYVVRPDDVPVALWGRNREYLAVWDEVLQPPSKGKSK